MWHKQYSMAYTVYNCSSAVKSVVYPIAQSQQHSSSAVLHAAVQHQARQQERRDMSNRNIEPLLAAGG